MVYPFHYGTFIEALFERIHRRNVRPLDRRPRDRPMEVLALGMSRTGTDSLCTALKELGYNETYHGFSTAEHPSDLLLFRQALVAKFEGKGKPFQKDDWDKLYGNCMAVSDITAALFAPELIKAYPDAKVILTERDVDSWYRSADLNVERIMKSRWMMFLWHFQWELWCMLTVVHMWKVFCRGDFRTFGKIAYLEHNEMIKKIVPKEKLLVYHVSQGWGPLCDFLKKEIPLKDMPRGNASAEFSARVGKIIAPRAQVAFRRVMVFLGFMIAVLAVGVLILVRYFA